MENTKIINQDIIDIILRTGSNNDHGIMRLIFNFMSEKAEDESTAYIRDEYGIGGKRVEIEGVKYAVWFDEREFTITEGTTASDPRAAKVKLTWPEVSERIHELLLLGAYAPQPVLDAAKDNAISEAAESLIYMVWELTGGVSDTVFEGQFSFVGNFPETKERIVAEMHDPALLARLIHRLQILNDMYNGDQSIIRSKWCKPELVLQKFKDIAAADHIFQAEDSFEPEHVPMFITQDEIDAYLVGGKYATDRRLYIYSEFCRHREREDRVAFLKSYFGTGGHSHALSADRSSADYDGKG